MNGQTYATTGGSGSGLTIQGTGTGGMVGATVVNGGSGYEVGDVVQTATAYPASIRIDSVTNHTQATGTATINSSGVVTGVTITEGGSGYTGDSHTQDEESSQAEVEEEETRSDGSGSEGEDHHHHHDHHGEHHLDHPMFSHMR